LAVDSIEIRRELRVPLAVDSFEIRLDVMIHLSNADTLG